VTCEPSDDVNGEVKTSMSCGLESIGLGGVLMELSILVIGDGGDGKIG
jgi:hypothetical protein